MCQSVPAVPLHPSLLSAVLVWCRPLANRCLLGLGDYTLQRRPVWEKQRWSPGFSLPARWLTGPYRSSVPVCSPDKAAQAFLPLAAAAAAEHMIGRCPAELCTSSSTQLRSHSVRSFITTGSQVPGELQRGLE